MENLKNLIKEREEKYLQERIADFLNEINEVKENQCTRIEKIYLYRKTPYQKNRVMTVLKRLKEKTEKTATGKRTDHSESPKKWTESVANQIRTGALKSP